MCLTHWKDNWLTPTRASERDNRCRVFSRLILHSLYFIAAAGATVVVALLVLNVATTTTCLRPQVRREWRSLGKDEKEEYISAAKCGIQEQVGAPLVFTKLQHDLTLLSSRRCIVSAMASNVLAYIRAETARALRIRRPTSVRDRLQPDSLAD